MLFARAAIARALPFSVYIASLIFNAPLEHLCLSAGIDVRWLYPLRVSAVGLLIVWYWPQYIEFNPAISFRVFSRLKKHAYLTSVLAGIAVFLVWIAPYPSWALMHDATGFNPMKADGSGVDIWFATCRVLGAVLVVSIMEELFWRSFIMRWFHQANFLQVNPSSVGKFAFVSTAVLFGLEHSLWLAGLIGGLVYAWLYVRERNLWAAVIAHAVTNGLLGAWVIYTENWRYW